MNCPGLFKHVINEIDHRIIKKNKEGIYSRCVELVKTFNVSDTQRQRRLMTDSDNEPEMVLHWQGSEVLLKCISVICLY